MITVQQYWCRGDHCRGWLIIPFKVEFEAPVKKTVSCPENIKNQQLPAAPSRPAATVAAPAPASTGGKFCNITAYRVLSLKWLWRSGDSVKKGQKLIVLEATKWKMS